MPNKSTFTTSYLMAMVMFDPSLTIYGIFANQVTCQKFDLKMKVKVKVKEAKNGTCEILLEIFESIFVFFRILAPGNICLLKKVCTYTYIPRGEAGVTV